VLHLQVFGISSDTPEDNKAFATAQRLPFPLLTDPSSILRKVRLHPPLASAPGLQTLGFSEGLAIAVAIHGRNSFLPMSP
jgi:peroxiredoxin